MTNLLINETSPYLLQHAHNPVNWMAWGEEALEKASREKKMLLISIGYAACHWCHVMEHECFESMEVASIMNENYVCIKVDREERPDVDQVYMNAAYLISGSGGWPLNALALPGGKPFFAGTYFPKDRWVQLLNYFAAIYSKDPSSLQTQAEQVSKGIRDMEHIPMNKAAEPFTAGDLEGLFETLEKKMDTSLGGTRGSMKFPMPSIWEFLLQFYALSGNERAKGQVILTLDAMALGGIYDQVGGGFSRYATDPGWHVPHFEKMLYDNGQLISLYSKAYKLTKKTLYKDVVYQTIEFAARELNSPEGGFYSSLDADSEGEEGKFYVWSDPEIREVLKDNAFLYSDYFGITPEGNWEHGKNIPDIHKGRLIGGRDKGAEEKTRVQMKLLNSQLLAVRQNRVSPATDDKMLTSWNALMISGLVHAYQAFGEERFLKSATQNLHFLLTHLRGADHSLFRNYKNGRATIHAFLDDYAFLISALITYYQATFEEACLKDAEGLIQYVLTHFYDKESGMFFFTNQQFSNLIVKGKEVPDNVIPSSNSEMAKNLYLMGLYKDNSAYISLSLQMVMNVLEDMGSNPAYYSNWAQAMILHAVPPLEVAIVGPDFKSKLAAFQKNFLPGVIYSGGLKESKLPLLEGKGVYGKTMIYVCRNKTCGLPVEELQEALAQINSGSL